MNVLARDRDLLKSFMAALGELRGDRLHERLRRRRAGREPDRLVAVDQRLRQRCLAVDERRLRARGAEATLIDDENAIDADLLGGHETVGLTAGASTPEELVQAVLARLAEAGYGDHEEVTVAREDVHFRLPRQVVAR